VPLVAWWVPPKKPKSKTFSATGSSREKTEEATQAGEGDNRGWARKKNVTPLG